MSTMVQMPVRVKPPPAETGEIISPGCASLEMATPSNGARTTMSARSVFAGGDLRLGDLDLLLRHRNPRLERLDLRLRGVELGARDDLVLDQLLPAAERQLCFAQPRLVLGGCPPGGVELRLVHVEHRRAACESSSRASTCPLRTALPSSTKISRTLPVTFDETVARRRAVTYPDALRIEFARTCRAAAHRGLSSSDFA